MPEKADKQADADDQREAAIYPCQEPILDDAPTAFQQKVAERIADAIQANDGTPYAEQQISAIAAVLAAHGVRPPAGGAEQVVDPEDHRDVVGVKHRVCEMIIGLCDRSAQGGKLLLKLFPLCQCLD